MDNQKGKTKQTDKVTEIKTVSTNFQTEPIYTVDTLALLLGVSEITIRSHTSTGKIKGYKRMGKWFYFHSDVVNFLKGNG